jgi:uncharacterized damage-inducible protein DinB
MFCTIADFLRSWDYESQSTLKMLRALTDASLNQRVTPDGRSLGTLAWHITTSVSDMAGQAGLPVRATRADEPVPAAAAAIAAAYEQAATALAEAVKANWSDAQLPDELSMYGEKWTKGSTLAMVIAHQTHHRGQVTVLMRQAGLVVAGVYGPAKEEWAAHGVPPQA